MAAHRTVDLFGQSQEERKEIWDRSSAVPAWASRCSRLCALAGKRKRMNWDWNWTSSGKDRKTARTRK